MSIAKKSNLIAYILLVVGGFFALHLLYLKRSRQAVLYCCTFSGFGLGVFYDLINIPRYVSQSNLDEDYIELHMEKRRKRNVDISFVRCLAEIVFGCILAIGLFSAIKVDNYSTAYYLLLCIVAPTFVAYGVWFIGGIGSERLEFGQSLLGAILTLPLLLKAGPSNLFYTAISSAAWANYRGIRLRALEEIHLEQKQWYSTHVMKFVTFTAIIYCLLFSTLYYNTYITTNDGVKVPLNEAVNNFFNSQAYRDLKIVLKDLIYSMFTNGFSQSWRRFIKISDPLGEDAAFKTLELEPGASEAQIDKQCRKLLRDHHPDRFRDEEEKKKEQDIFINVQSACDRLSSIRRRRNERNRQSVREDL